MSLDAPAKPKRSKKGRRDWKPQWLAAYQSHGTAKAASEVIGVNECTPYEARNRDPEFAKAWDALENETTKLLEETLYQRALNGDTTAAIFMLKARRPAKYREALSVKHSGTVKHNVATDFDREVEGLVEKMREAAAEDRDPALSSG